MLIERIKSPRDLKSLNIEELKTLSEELRSLIIERVSINGGHLASNLGVVELTIALHYVFASPEDKIIWDVGHQSYPHKLLTGRYGEFPTIRQYKGISGFPRIGESPHDIFGTGHSSTSISAALGVAEARDVKGDSFKVIAVIGDGALTSGLAFEGLNHAGHLKKDLVVILNDNEMSISRNVGAMSNYLSKVLTGTFYRRLKKETKALLEGIPRIGGSVAKIAQKAEGSLKGFFLPGGLFEDLGFNYVGPVDGHDIPLLLDTLQRIKEVKEPILFHVVTKKGKGYKFSEEDPCVYHGIGPFEVETGIVSGASPAAEECVLFSDVFGSALTELAAVDERVVAITAAMKEGTGLTPFAERFPRRLYDVGIAEPHAVTFAAGLAVQGLRPVVAIYSTFLQRAYDEIIHDVCLQNLPVVFAIDRAGIVGEDGATHQGLFDISFLRHIPNLVLMAPKDDTELREMLRFALKQNGPVAFRYPRGRIWQYTGEERCNTPLERGRAEVVREGKDIALIAVGTTVFPALKAAETLRKDGFDPCVINARFIKPLDEALLASLFSRIKRIVTVEENLLAGGFGSAVLECLNKTGTADVTVKRVGIGDVFVEHGSPAILRKKYGLDEEGIYKAALSLLKTE
ncbi:MAG: 1-deoxy-D-xylulose-5-phosphate synthase [Alphaproteobacteria bacterium]|uniref:1-deoxy-D-xylulose-5-phosphate synthase n=1 Tax=Candidatus Nitrobium versatile TaxID=2884831 RepID=A0A953M152_9BACT|nr:1-deoxy-D-xylulose-5-phosphate synthase [Candidatus Nitrobium versatile]